jgi:hypothetical protein
MDSDHPDAWEVEAGAPGLDYTVIAADRMSTIIVDSRSVLGSARFRHVSIYVDHAFAVGDWGRWTGGGHLQADAVPELHAFAAGLGLRPEWFQTTPGRPEKDHYDLTRAGRELAIARGALAEDRRAGTRRRQAIRRARQASGSPAASAPRD